jgi:hypothetical protein
MNGLTSAQQLLHIAMFTPPEKMPNFPPSITVVRLGDSIARMFADGFITHLSLDSNGNVRCY